MKSLLSIVVPCYNEELVLDKTNEELLAVLNGLIHDGLVSSESKIVYVNDGSKDATWEKIAEKAQEFANVEGVKLSRNFGHQSALLAGMNAAIKYSDCIVTIDADLQDDVRAIPEFIKKYHEGYEIVYGVRDKRDTDTFFKRNSALCFYSMMGKLGVRLVPNHADYRLLSKRALKELLKYKEENVFLRGIIPLLGFKTSKVFYNRKERFAGESKYPLKKMIAFAMDGLTSFSIVPIKMVSLLGFIVVGIGVAIAVYSFISWLLNHTISGWTSIMLSIWLIGGMQLVAIGVIGEYIGKVFTETKQRPRYTIEKDTYREKVNVLNN